MLYFHKEGLAKWFLSNPQPVVGASSMQPKCPARDSVADEVALSAAEVVALLGEPTFSK